MIISEATVHDDQVILAEELRKKEDYKGATEKATEVLDDLESKLPIIAQAALTKGQSMTKDVLIEMSQDGKLPPAGTWETIYKNLELSEMLNPDCDVTKEELLKVSHMLREIPPAVPPKAVRGTDYDVIIVGAGAAGVGTALMLTKTFNVERKRVLMVERGKDAGETFRKWPEEMRFISPSFNQQGWTSSFDLNSISKGTSPAYSLHSEHPSGKEYAAYLSAIVKTNELPIRKQTEVVSVKSVGTKDLPLFNVTVQPAFTEERDNDDGSQGDLLLPPETLSARYIVWAAGEFQYPKKICKDSCIGDSTSTAGEEKKSERDTYNNSSDETKKEEAFSKGNVFTGSHLCMHNSQVRSWASLPGSDYVVIGGYESGIDATVNLSKAGKSCKVLASSSCWSVKTADPSSELAPYTAARLREVLAPKFSPQPKLFAPLRVEKVERDEQGEGFIVHAVWKEQEKQPHAPLRELVTNLPTEQASGAGSTLVLHTPNPPILCTGFEGSVAAAASHLFDIASSDEEDNKKDDKDNSEEVVFIEEHNHDEHKGGCLDGAPRLTENDESTKIPGVFLVGPTVSHGTLSFCFVYKFRQRFAIVAKTICEGLGIDTRAAVNECRKANMYLDEFSCCGDTCGDVC